MKAFAGLLCAVLLCFSLASCAAPPSGQLTPVQSTPPPSTLPSPAPSSLAPAREQAQTNSPAPQETTRPAIRQISASYKAFFILYEDGSLWAWGDNQYAQIGDGTKDYRTRFVKILDGVQRLTPNNMAIRSDHTLWSWGGDQLTPKQLMADVLDANVNTILKTDGTLWAYGSRFFALGDGIAADTQSKEVVPIDQMKQILCGVRSVPAGGLACAAIKDDGSLWTWGECLLYQSTNRNYQKAVTSGVDPLVPVKVMDGVTDVVALDAWSSKGMLALTQDGTVLQWGWYMPNSMQDEPMMAQGSNPVADFPDIQAPFTDKAVDIAANNNFFAVLQDGRVLTWGYEGSGEGTNADANALQDKVGPIGWAGPNRLDNYQEIAQGALQVAANADTLLVLKADGSLLAAGKACYDPQAPDNVSEKQVLTPAFHEMWAAAGAAIPSTPEPSAAPDSAAGGISTANDDNPAGLDCYQAIELSRTDVMKKIDGKDPPPLIVFANECIDTSAKGMYRNPVFDVFSGNEIGYMDYDSKTWRFVGTDFLPGTYAIGAKTSIESYFGLYRSEYANTFAQGVNLANIHTVKDLREFYIKTIPENSQCIIPQRVDVRRIHKDDYVETVTVGGEDKMLFVTHRDETTKVEIVSEGGKVPVRDLNSTDIISGRMVYFFQYKTKTEDYMTAARNTTEFNFSSGQVEYRAIPQDPPNVVPMSKFFKGIKDVPYDQPLTVEELTAFYKAHIPPEEQLLLTVQN